MKNDSRINSNGWTTDERPGSDGNAILLRHPNGLKAGRFSTEVAYYAGHDFSEFGSMTNIVESSIGSFGPIRFDQLEADTTNNESSGHLNWTPRMSKGRRLERTPAGPLT